MITNGLQGFVLHQRGLGDTSAQVSFFTREHGVVSARSQGGRTPKKQALLQAFTPLWLCFDVRADWYYVRQIDVLASSFVLAGDALFAGLYVNELIYHGLHQLDPSPVLYDVYVHMLQTLVSLSPLSDRLSIEAALRRFEWQFLSSCGYAFSLTHDAITHIPIVADHQYDFIAGEGLVLASKGIPGQSIIAMACDHLDDALVLKAAKWIMRRAIDHALGGVRIKARELYVRA